MHNMTKKEYKELADKLDPHGKNFINYFYAFLFGGIICVIGELLKYLYTHCGFSEDVVKMLVPATIIILAGILTIAKVFHNIAKIAGAGTLIPITGFANAVVAPAMEFKTEGYILGTGVKMFVIAGPVIAYATLSGVIYGLLYLLFNLLR